MFAFGGMGAASRFILVVWNDAHTCIRYTWQPHAAMQWHASRYVSHRTKGVDLASLIVYNLSNWTGFEERPMPQGLPSV
jgi:hypothetical protein